MQAKAGQHGFNYAQPSSIKNGQNLSINLRAVGNGFILNGSPRTINCSGGRLSVGESSSTNLTDDQLVVYPNSASGQFRVRFLTQPQQTNPLQVVDLVGRKVVERTITGLGGVQEEMINLSQEAGGVYLIQLQQGTKTRVEKVILQNK